MKEMGEGELEENRGGGWYERREWENEEGDERWDGGGRSEVAG